MVNTGRIVKIRDKHTWVSPRMLVAIFAEMPGKCLDANDEGSGYLFLPYTVTKSPDRTAKLDSLDPGRVDGKSLDDEAFPFLASGVQLRFFTVMSGIDCDTT
jgi:hypothetical protein